MSEKFNNSQTKNMFLMFFYKNFIRLISDLCWHCIPCIYRVSPLSQYQAKNISFFKNDFLKRSLNFLLETQNVFWIYLNSKHDKIWGKMSKKRWKDCFCLHPIIRFSYCLTNRWRFLFKTVSISTRSKHNG